MSWKGFKKGVARLPQRVMQKTGHSESTNDEEFNDMEERFKFLVDQTKRLNDDSKKFKQAIQDMLQHQLVFANTLGEVYRPIAGRSGEPREPRGAPRMDTPADALKAAEAFSAKMQEAQEQLQTDLEQIDRKIVSPCADFLAILETVKKSLIKRSHKVLDYDRHRDSLRKAKEKQNRDLNDERKIARMEQELENASREFEAINALLKKELPVLFDFRIQFIDPCFQFLYFYQLKMFYTLQNIFQELIRQHGGQATNASEILSSFEQKFANVENLIGELTILNPRSFFVASGSRSINSNGDRQSIDGSSGGPTSPHSLSNASETKSPYASQSESNPSFNMSSMLASIPAAKGSASGNSFNKSPPAYSSTAQSTPAVQYCLALYDYDAQADGDLSFKRNDKIEVVQKTDKDNDWWTGRLKGQTGVFPANYVRLL